MVTYNGYTQDGPGLFYQNGVEYKVEKGFVVAIKPSMGVPDLNDVNWAAQEIGSTDPEAIRHQLAKLGYDVKNANNMPAAKFGGPDDAQPPEATHMSDLDNWPGTKDPLSVSVEDFWTMGYEVLLNHFKTADDNVAEGHSGAWQQLASGFDTAVSNFKSTWAQLNDEGGWKGDTQKAVEANLQQAYPEFEAVTFAMDALHTLIDVFDEIMWYTKKALVTTESDYRNNLANFPTYADQIKQGYNEYAKTVGLKVYEPPIRQIAANNPATNSGAKSSSSTPPPPTPPPAPKPPTPPDGGKPPPFPDDFHSPNLGGGPSGGGSGATPPDFTPPDLPPPGVPGDPNGTGLPGGPGDPNGAGLPGGPGDPNGFGAPGGPGDPNGAGLPGGPGDPNGFGAPGGPGDPNGAGPPGGPKAPSGAGLPISGLSSALSPVSDAIKQATNGAKGGAGMPREGALDLGKGPNGINAPAGAGAGGLHAGGGGGAGVASRALGPSSPPGVPVAAANSEPRLAAPGLPTGAGPGAGAGGAGGGSGGGSGSGQRGPGGKEHKPTKALRGKRNGEAIIGEPDAVVAVIGAEDDEQRGGGGDGGQLSAGSASGAGGSQRYQQSQQPGQAPPPVRQPVRG
jgi:hypothetical protein